MKKMSTSKKALTVILSLAFLFVLSGGIYQYSRASALGQEVENQYMSAFSDLADYINDIEVLLDKAMLANGRRQLSKISSEIFMETASAKAALARLPLSDTNLEGISKFLSQTGDYMAYLSQKASTEASVTEEEFQNIFSLCEFAEIASENLENIRKDLYSGKLSFDNKKKIDAVKNETGTGNIQDGFGEMENEFIEYPSLIYDGPFSEHIETMEPVFLKYQRQVTDEMALSYAKKILGDKRAENLVFSDEGGGSIETYIFSSKDSGSLSIAITKQGGHPLWMLDSREVNEENISVEEAQLKASEFLQSIGYSSMKESYYEKNANIATLNFAYKQGDVMVYSDLIKVKVALDNGEIVGIETRGYLMSHRERTFMPPEITENEAREKAAKHLSISEVNMALIPLDSKREVFCYELKGTFDDKNFLIYINASTGEEEKILMLLESPNGIFTL